MATFQASSSLEGVHQVLTINAENIFMEQIPFIPVRTKLIDAQECIGSGAIPWVKSYQAIPCVTDGVKVHVLEDSKTNHAIGKYNSLKCNLEK